jgi:hypothetical protein
MKIKKLEINSFRGIPNQLIIDFPIKNNKPSSLIILGDNGVGKSSIVDSIEFCLQGHISQTKLSNLTNTPSVKSFYSKFFPSINITFENLEKINRKIIPDEQGLLSNVTKPHKLFSVSPFVIRRHDILRFINSSEAERTLVFSNYLRKENDSDWVEHPIDEIKRLQDDRLKAKKDRDILLKKLSDELKIDSQKIPFERKAFNEFVKEHIYGGLPKTQFESLGFKVKLNKKAELLAEEVYIEIENHRQIRAKVNSFSIAGSVTTFPKHLLSQLEGFLIKVSEKLTISFLEISPLEFIDKIEIVYQNESILALSLNLILKNKQKCSPNQLLSEANLDLLALLFYLAFIQESAERGQSKFIILDDVLQSVDSTIRVNFITYLLKNFSDWQFIITAHDRLWHRQLVELMNLYSHQYFNLSLASWSFENGPVIKNITFENTESLYQAIEDNNLINICSNSGLLLEEICDGLSKSLNTSLQRKKEDKYTLGDLFPGIVKLLKKTTLNKNIETIQKWLHLRNLIGAHYNEWALSLSFDEAKSFGLSVLSLHELVKCKNCSSWIINNYEFKFYACKCGKLIIQK